MEMLEKEILLVLVKQFQHKYLARLVELSETPLLAVPKRGIQLSSLSCTKQHLENNWLNQQVKVASQFDPEAQKEFLGIDGTGIYCGSSLVSSHMSPASSVTFTSLKGSHSDSTSLYTLLDLLHPDSSNLPSFHLSFLDTIFYTGDNNVQYIYKVPSSQSHIKGQVLKMSRCMGKIWDMFLKRREMFLKGAKTVQKNRPHRNSLTSGNHKTTTKDKPCTKKSNEHTNCVNSATSLQAQQYQRITQSPTCSSLLSRRKKPSLQLDYIVELRYRDQSSVRLTEQQFMTMLINPLLANQRFRHLIDGSYIQSLPLEWEQFGLASAYRIHFCFDIFKENKLFEVATQIMDSSGLFGREQWRSEIEIILKDCCEQTYLNFLVFQMVCFVKMHHNRRIKKGVFVFVRVEEKEFALATVQRLIMEDVSEYGRVFLFRGGISETQFSADERDRLEKQKKKIKELLPDTESSELLKVIQGYFAKTNADLKESMKQFVAQKMANITNQKGKLLSKMIFKVINPSIEQDLYNTINDKQALQTLIRSKQKEDHKSYLRSKHVKTDVALSKQNYKLPHPKLFKKAIKKKPPSKLLQGKVLSFVYEGIHRNTCK